MPEVRNYPAWMTFPISTVSGAAAWVFVHPLDVMKVRMAVAMEKRADSSVPAVLKSIMHERGALGLYDGLSAGIARQLVYTTARLGLYDVFRDMITDHGKEPTALQRIGAGAVSGGTAAFLSCPTEVSLVRMQADSHSPPEQRRGYKNVGDALQRIVREEGLATFFRGATPTVVRAVAVGITQVSFYDQCKSWLVNSGHFAAGSTGTFVAASVSTGVFYSFMTMPIETVKIRMQNQKRAADGTLQYKSLSSSLVRIVRNDGVRSLWRGYMPYFSRCALYTVVCFFVMDNVKAGANWAYDPKRHLASTKVLAAV